ncbi:MAG: hypothetical protein AAF334_06650 [Pseudomonadota bacterium]
MALAIALVTTDAWADIVAGIDAMSGHLGTVAIIAAIVATLVVLDTLSWTLLTRRR